jgi:hypothetical protein
LAFTVKKSFENIIFCDGFFAPIMQKLFNAFEMVRNLSRHLEYFIFTGQGASPSEK